MEKIDAAIVGAGPAGLSAGMYLHLRGRKTIIFEANLPGGNAENIPLLQNYPGLKSMTGNAFVERLMDQAKQFNVTILERHEVVDITVKDTEKIVKVQAPQGIKEYSCKVVFLCIGGDHQHLGIPGESDYQYKGISYCAVCDGSIFTGKKVAVIGNGNQAVQSALYMSQIARKTFYITHGSAKFDKFYRDQLEEKDVEFFAGYNVKEFKGDETGLKRVVMEKEGEEVSKKIKGAFIAAGTSSLPALPQKIGCKLDEEGRIIVSNVGETNIPGIYAAGDCIHGSEYYIVSAIGLAVRSVSDSDKYFE